MYNMMYGPRVVKPRPMALRYPTGLVQIPHQQYGMPVRPLPPVAYRQPGYIPYNKAPLKSNTPKWKFLDVVAGGMLGVFLTTLVFLPLLFWSLDRSDSYTLTVPGQVVLSGATFTEALNDPLSAAFQSTEATACNPMNTALVNSDLADQFAGM